LIAPAHVPSYCNPDGQINRSVVRRLARRATIGIPCLGLLFLTRVLRRDAASFRAHLAKGDTLLVLLFGLAVAAEICDVVAQTANITCLGLSSGLLPAPASLAAGLHARLGLAALPAALAAADKASLAMAALSCASGLAAEFIEAQRTVALARSGDVHCAGGCPITPLRAPNRG
jgi:hypothetical protein